MIFGHPPAAPHFPWGRIKDWESDHGLTGTPIGLRRDDGVPSALEAGTIQRLAPDPAEQARADAREAREAIERQKDREEREAAAKRAHALEVMRLTLDHNVAVREARSVDPCYVAWLMAGAAALASLVTGLVAAVIP